MRTLFVANTLPFPLDAGTRLRTYHLLKGVARVSKVTLVSPIRDGEESAATEALSFLCEKMIFFPSESFADQRAASRWLPRRIFNVLKFHGHPTEPALFRWSKSVEAERLLARLSLEDYDLIWARHAIAMSWLPEKLETRVIVDLDDVQHRKLAHRIRQAPWSGILPLTVFEYWKLRRLELHLDRFPYEFVVCSEQDRRVLGGGPRLWVVPNGTDVPERVPPPRRRVVEPVFVFVGAMYSDANSDAACYFRKRIFPLIQREVPEARFLIVGREPKPALLKLHDGNSVIVTGEVQSVAPYLDQAAVSVVPIRFGGGTRIKILESLAHCLPVVSTTVGAEGLEFRAGEHLVLADSPAEFAGACVRLWRDEPYRHQLARRGFELVRNRYDWAQIECRVGEIASRDELPAGSGSRGTLARVRSTDKGRVASRMR